MYAELGSHDFKECHHKKRLDPCRQRELGEEIVKEYKAPISRACKIAQLPRSQYYYRNVKNDSAVIAALHELAAAHPTYGFRKLFAYLRRAGYGWNHKKVYRIYQQLKMNKQRKGKRRLPQRVKQPLQQPDTINKSWSMDFMSDSLVRGRKFRT